VAAVDPATLPKAPVTIPVAGADDDDVEAEVCFICASPVIHQSVAPCNHRTCHICSLRMRALYKSKECAHCRTLAPFVIFTDDGTKRYEDYADADITTTDDNIGIRYAKEDIVGDTVLLLRYNCPEESCDFAGLGWPNLHKHVRSTHNKKMCDLCTRNKKVFTHEHELFTDKELEKHMRHGDDKPGAIDQTGFKGHPLCAFCGSRFYDADKLYEHCREKHERCFLCDRQDPRQPHYYRDYNSLEEHFKKDHFLCYDRECLEKKFVVFASDMDLKAHQLAEHGTTLTKDVRRDARHVDISGFDYRQPYQEPTRGGRAGRGGRGRDNRDGGGGGGEGRDGRRGRDPNSEPIPASSAQPLRRDELAFQRQMAIHSSQSVSTRTFGGQLSSSNPTPAAASAASGRNSGAAAAAAAPPTAGMDGLAISEANMTPEDRARQVRHGAVLERAANLLQNDQNKLTTFRSHISSYRQGKQTGTALIDAFFSLFTDTSASALGTLVREVADLFEEKGKADALRKAWSDWRAINEDYPALPGLMGMHGATTSNSGWASAASSTPAQSSAGSAANNQRHTTRVLKLKSSTQQSRRSSMGQAGGVLVPTTAAARPPPAATAASAFPSLPSAGGKASANAASRATSNALWGVSSHSTNSGPSSVQHSTSSVSSGSYNRPPPVRNTNRGGAGEDAFPALPAAPKPTTTIFGYGTGRSVRRDYGHGSSSNTFSWNGGASGSGAPAGEAADEVEEEASAGGGKGKKGGKGRKKVLVQWG